MVQPHYQPGWILSCLLQVALVSAASAHTTVVSGEIAGTWHVEPNHNPKAGEPTQVWIALTQAGGTIIPLEQCDCQLTIHAVPYDQGEAPLLTPPLIAVSPERYQGIPSAEVTFPALGQYTLTLTGRPMNGASFEPFELHHDVIVASGVAPTLSPVMAPVASVPTPEALASPQGRPFAGWVALGLGAIALVGVGLALWIRQRATQSD